MRERIPELFNKGKAWVLRLGDEGNPWWVTGVVVSVSIISFCLGRMSKLEDIRPPLTIERAALISTTVGERSQVLPRETGSGSVSSGAFVASDGGTKYYPVGCSGAKRITAAHRIYFESAQAAVAAGYSLAATCVPK